MFGHIDLFPPTQAELIDLHNYTNQLGKF